MIASRKCLPGQRYSISLMPMRALSNKYLGSHGLAPALGLLLIALANAQAWAEQGSSSVEPTEILAGVRAFFARTAGAVLSWSSIATFKRALGHALVAFKKQFYPLTPA